MRKALTITLIILTISLSLSSQRVLAQNLTLYLFTDKGSYFMGDYVTIYGNLTKDDQPVLSNLVAIEVKNESKILVLRTLQTEPNSTIYCPVYIWRVIPCDEYGHPQNSFPRPSPGGGSSSANFKVELANFSNETQTPLVTVNLFDSTGISLGYSSAHGLSLPPDQVVYWAILPIPIPYDAGLGNATVYASAFAEWPEYNGTAYCPEKNATLEITGSGGLLSNNDLTTPQSRSFSIETTGENGTYNMTFRLNPFSSTGTYTIYAASQYENQPATASTAFVVGVKGDLNEDGAVDSTDLGILGLAWGSLIGDPSFNPKADLNDDGAIDSTDLGIMGIYWGYIA